MAVLVAPTANFADSRIFFIHNWRCAGSTLNSIFSSNFGDSYVKIGTQFSEYGWPLYDVQERLTLAEIRDAVGDGCILGGHLCVGIDALVPGNWDLWINAREPLKRISSGILRFHAKKFRLPPGQYTKDYVYEHAERTLKNLLDGPLLHERNGVAKRLAGLAIATSFSVQPDVDLEKLSCFDFGESDFKLIDAAKKHLDAVKIIIMPEYLHASLICIERMYDLPPLINLFSDLRHNSGGLGKASNSEKQAFSMVEPMLAKICAIDQELWLQMCRQFSGQLRRYSISKRSVVVREKLHETAFLKRDWFDDESFDDSQIISAIVDRLDFYGQRYPEFALDFIELVTSWSRFDCSAAQEIRERALARHK